MALSGYGFEGLANGDPIPVGGGAFYTDSSINPAATLLASTSAASTGSVGARITLGAAGIATWLEKRGLNVPALSASIRFKKPTPPASSQNRLVAVYSAAGAILFRLDLNSDGRILFRNSSAGTVAGLSTPTGQGAAVPVGAWYEWRFWADPTSGQVRSHLIRLDTDTVTNSTTGVTTESIGSGNVDGWHIGQVLSSTGVDGYTFDLDDAAVETAPTSGQLIDAVVAANIPPTVTLTHSPSNPAPGATVTLTATATDGDGTITSTSFTQVSPASPTPTLSGSGLTRTFTAPTGADGAYLFRFAATDNDDAESTADTTVVVGTATSAVTHYNTAEGGTVGAEVTASNSGGGSGAAFQTVARGSGASVSYVSTTPAHGSRAYRVNAPASSHGSLVWVTGGMSVAYRAYFRLPSHPTAATYLVAMLISGASLARVYLRTDGKFALELVDPGGSPASTTVLDTPVATGSWVRLELWANVNTGKTRVAWAAGDAAGYTDDVEVTYPLGNSPIAQVQTGKYNATSWAADFLVDDLALNTRANRLIGPYAATYTEPAAAGADVYNIEPGTTVTLAGTGTGSWSQVSGPAVTLTDVGGGEATYEAPYTLTGATLVFDYGEDEVAHHVMRATERVLIGGTAYPVKRVLVT